MQEYTAELHIHTVLSPCAEIEMIPPLIIQEALERGINLIAITDHNSSANVEAVQKAASGSGLVVLPGMETQTQEEVHVLCLFDTLDQLQAWQEVVDQRLPAIPNQADHFGEQFVVDASGEYIRSEGRLLINSVQISIDELVMQVHQLGGLAIPAHVDRQAFGLIANLGFVPPELEVDALEISRFHSPEQVCQKFPQLKSYPLIQDGDVHLLEDMIGANLFWIQAPTIAEIRMALRKEAGRFCQIRTDSIKIFQQC